MKIQVFNEPDLEFGHGQKIPSPHDGLLLYGPSDLNIPSRPLKIHYALVGVKEAVPKFTEFIKIIKGPITPDKNQNIWPLFPGFKAIFHCEISENPSAYYEIDPKRLEAIYLIKNVYQRTNEIVSLYIDRLLRLKQHDEKIDVVICLVPDEIEQLCRPSAVTSKRMVNDTTFNVDFRRQLKARAMQVGLPIQILRDSTLRPSNEKEFRERGLTPLSDRAWNFSTTLYYKAGGKPWKLSSIREGVCYIGIGYILTGEGPNSQSACCAAQMFLKDGDGVVFKGEDGPWYSPREKSFHLTEDASEKLLRGVVESYEALDGKPLKEIFLHCHSEIHDDEYRGFMKACPKDVKLVIIKVKVENDFKLIRDGQYPVRRGTFVKMNTKSCYLWGAGYKQSMKTYDGWEVPSPLRIDILYGEAGITEIAHDILCLTKLNYNSCKMGNASPVTIGYSKQVGEILVKNNIAKAQPQFRFYI